jgi:hypothetical protein
MVLSPDASFMLECPFRMAGRPVEARKMVKRLRAPPTTLGSSKAPAGRRPRPDIVHSSLYLPEPVYEALRETAFKERCKIHDLVIQGVDLALRKRGYPSIDDLKAAKKR